MGIISYVACRQCKIVRDLDKYYSVDSEVENKEQMLAFSKDLGRDAFRHALLISFIVKHSEHDCVFYTEYSSLDEEFDTYQYKDGKVPEYTEDFDFWG